MTTKRPADWREMATYPGAEPGIVSVRAMELRSGPTTPGASVSKRATETDAREFTPATARSER